MNTMAHTFPRNHRAVGENGQGIPERGAGDPPPPPTTNVRQNIPLWVPALASFAILVGISLCAYLVLQSAQGGAITPVTFFLALFMLLFALGTLTAMLFITSESFKASTSQFSLMIGGPAAIWFGGTLAIMYSPIQGQLFKAYEWPDTIKALEKTILDIERRARWITYSDWKRRNRDFYEQVVNEERSLLSELLENAFMFPSIPASNPNAEPTARSLLKSPKITTAFLYFPKFIVKFQTISGEREDNADKTDMFYDSRATDGGTPTKALLCAAADAGGRLKIRKDLTEIIQDRYSHGWEAVRGDKVNCLLAVRYNDAGRTSRHDRILIDMKKFTNSELGGAVDLAVLNYQYQVAKGSVMWQLKGSVGTSSRQVPLVFRSYNTGNLPSLFAHQQDASGQDDPRYAVKIREELSAWLQRVDQYLRQDPAEWDKLFFTPLIADIASELKFLNQVKGTNYQVGDSPGLADLLATPSVGVSAFHVKNATDVTVVFVRPET